MVNVGGIQFGFADERQTHRLLSEECKNNTEAKEEVIYGFCGLRRHLIEFRERRWNGR